MGRRSSREGPPILGNYPDLGQARAPPSRRSRAWPAPRASGPTGSAIAGGTASAAALAKAVQVGARGVIVGSIEEGELSQFLKVQDGSLWRVGLPDWQLPQASPAITIVVTEGFGRGAMAAPFYDALTASDGDEISLCGVTRLASGLRRPEVILPVPGGKASDGSALPVAALAPGATVRLIDHDHLGLIGTVREAPRRRRFEGDLLLDALVVELPNGEPSLVPTANVEVLA